MIVLSPNFFAFSHIALHFKFNQIQLRESEIKELEVLEKKVPCEVKVTCRLF